MSAVRGVVRHALRLGRVERNGIEAESEGVFNGHCRGIERMFAAERKVAVAERERRRVAFGVRLAVLLSRRHSSYRSLCIMLMTYSAVLDSTGENSVCAFRLHTES